MKKKIPLIAIIVALAICIFVVTKSITDKKSKENEYKELAQNVSQSANSETISKDCEKAFEFLQMSPKSGLAVIYNFKIYPEKDGVKSGSITIDGNGVFSEIACAVIAEGDADVFIFSKYLTDEKAGTALSAGDLAVKIHTKDGRVIPEWLGLQPMFDGEDIMPNF